MKIDIITIFPNQISSFIKEGIFNIAVKKGLLDINVHDLRKWSNDKHRTVDDHPFGGGAGMVMMVEPIFKAIKELKKKGTKVLITTPRGQTWDQKLVKNTALPNSHYIIICGHYEGFDERIYDHLVDMEISVGDYVLSGGEMPSLIIVDSLVRLIPGVLGNDKSLEEESFESGLEYPQYTRPEEFNGWKVPSVLLSGHHENIKKWKHAKSIELTKKRRPDLAK